jgi:hypothetical protein
MINKGNKNEASKTVHLKMVGIPKKKETQPKTWIERERELKK